jgi:hypothetical protein
VGAHPDNPAQHVALEGPRKRAFFLALSASLQLAADIEIEKIIGALN